MKKFMVLIIVLCFILISCVKSIENDLQTGGAPIKIQRFVGRFEEAISLNRSFKDKIMIQKEQEESFDIYSFDINSPTIKFEYSIKPQNNLLYSEQLDKDRILKVKQLGNSEEDNILLLEDRSTRNIAKKIAYSGSALISTSPSKDYIVYLAADDFLNRYGLYLYNLETEQTIQLIDTAGEELLNDMAWNISWSPEETFIVVSNKLVFDVERGKQIREIHAENILWSPSGNKLAFIKSDKGYGKAVYLLDVNTAAVEEVFIVNQGEYLPGYIVWNEKESKLAFVIALLDEAKELGDISPYRGIYSLDLKVKEAVRIDSILNLDPTAVENLVNLQYNADGSVLTFTITNHSDRDLYVYNLNTEDFGFFTNIEYLHFEDNENYVCSIDSRLYFVYEQRVMELDEGMTSRSIYRAIDTIEDLYISQDGNSMIIIEKAKDEIILRQLSGFANLSM
ncbi:MAG: hypothetical protein A2Y23_13555 [Clostridiales bacterium GWB2_37_7]|nr:MAG: hypothetical protein A2Y23_13555 [Clostridiales bacterium GWB2_37_7]